MKSGNADNDERPFLGTTDDEPKCALSQSCVTVYSESTTSAHGELREEKGLMVPAVCLPCESTRLHAVIAMVIGSSPTGPGKGLSQKSSG